MRGPSIVADVTELGSDSLRCARAVAVLGGQAELGVAQAVANLADDEFAAALDALVALGAVSVDAGHRMVVSDRLLVAALSDEAAPGERRVLHRRAFEHHIARNDLVAAAGHAAAGGLRGDARAVAALTQAAQSALVDGAVQKAVDNITTAMTLSGEQPPAELLAARAHVLFAAGRALEAVDAFTSAARADPGARSTLLMGAARAQAYAGRFTDAAASWDDLLSEAGGMAAAPASVLLERAHVLWALGGPRVGMDALPHGSAEPLVRGARALYALQAGIPDGVDELRDLASAARRSVAREPGDPSASFNSYLLHVTACIYLERFDEAEDHIAHALAWMRSSGVPTGTAALRFNLAGLLLRRGALADAAAELDGLEEAAVVDELLRPGVNLSRARLYLLSGRVDAVPELRQRAAESPAATGWFTRLMLGFVDADYHLTTGDPHTAWLLCRLLFDETERLALHEPCIVPWWSVAIDAASACGRTAELEPMMTRLSAEARALPCTWPRIVALSGRAAIAAGAGHVAEASALYEEALAIPAALPLERAKTALRYGRWLRRQGDTPHARSLLQSAYDIARACGAAAVADAATAELTAAGGRRRRRSLELTAQERRVAMLAADGATMREIAAALFLSTRTVETHLSHIYAKLGVKGKRDLRHHRGLLQPQSGEF